MRIDARLQIVYLVAVGCALFLISDPRVIAALLAFQVLLWLSLRRPLLVLLDVARRLLVFFLLVIASYALFPGEAQGDLVPIVGTWLQFSLSGLQAGGLMTARVLAVIYASMLIQRGEGQVLVQGLRGLGLPAFLAYALDNTLGLLAPEERGRGRGRRQNSGTTILLKRLLKGDIGFLVDGLVNAVERAQRRAERLAVDAQSRERVSDLAVVSGIAFVALSVKLLKIMPGLPIAPGHKEVVLIPLYILASELTSSRWGATQTGFVIGIVAFLMGEGKFGVFELFKYITPGLVVDLALPVMRLASRPPGPLAYALLGVGMAVARFSTIVLVALFVVAPPAFYALLAPIGAAHVCFGFASGFVTFHLLRSVERLKALR